MQSACRKCRARQCQGHCLPGWPHRDIMVSVPNRLYNKHTVKEDDVYSYGMCIYVVGLNSSEHMVKFYFTMLFTKHRYGQHQGTQRLLAASLGPVGAPLGGNLQRHAAQTPCRLWNAKNAQTLMDECWHVDPAMRPPFSDIKRRMREILESHL